jgi:uncharacterized protein
MPAVSALHVYPVKSCAGTPLARARIGRRGIVGDREWMLVGPDNVFLSQRTLPRLALVRPSIVPDGLRIEAPGMPPLHVARAASGARLAVVEVEVWGDVCEAEDAGREAKEWFTKYLDLPARLVRMTDENVRPVDPDFAVQPDDEVGFADGYPFLLISEASLADLNARLAEPLPMDRFRPNIVVADCEPYAEDAWGRFAIGGVPFVAVKPCSRCAVTTVDQSTGDRGKEPLRTLATYRKRGDKVMFGQNLVHLAEGEIRVGDAVRVG